MSNASKSIRKITQNLNKKGKLKGRNKKETKTLKGMCQHHKLNKKGKVKPSIFSNDGEYCICTICGYKFPAKFYDDDKIDEIVEDFQELNNQNKYTSVAINAGEQMNDYFAQTGVMLMSYKKNAKKVRNVADKQGKSKKNKNKHRNNNEGSARFGSWGAK